MQLVDESTNFITQNLRRQAYENSYGIVPVAKKLLRVDENGRSPIHNPNPADKISFVHPPKSAKPTTSQRMTLFCHQNNHLWYKCGHANKCALCLHFWLSFPRMRESTLVTKMDTRLRGYDTTSGKVKSCKDGVNVEEHHVLQQSISRKGAFRWQILRQLPTALWRM